VGRLLVKARTYKAKDVASKFKVKDFAVKAIVSDLVGKDALHQRISHYLLSMCDLITSTFYK